MTRGKLFVFEGPDGVGKTRLSRRLSEHLRAHGATCEYLSSPGSEPGTLGKLVYDLHHSPHDKGIASIDPTSLQMLHVAAHIDAIESRIRPSLERGAHVILDRFWWSTLVYGPTLGAEKHSIDRMVEIERWHWQRTEPTCVFLLSRKAPARGNEPMEQHLRISLEYQRLAAARDDERLVWITTDVAEDDSFAQILAGVERYI